MTPDHQRVIDALKLDAEAAKALAFDIADESMMEVLRNAAVPCDEFGMSWILVNDNFERIECLDEAEGGLKKAVEWLSFRGLCDIVETTTAEIVVVLHSSELGEERI